MICINVVTIRDNVVERNDLFVGENQTELTEKAQDLFIEICKMDENFNTIFADTVLENGFYEFEDSSGLSVCLSWPEIKKV